MSTDSGYYEVSAWGAPVGEGASGARYCTLDGVVKVAESPGDYVVANEFICGRLGLALGLPVPPGVVTKTDDGKVAYVSLRFGKQGEKPPHVLPLDVVADHPRTAAGIVLFDSWLLNGDRHAGNLAYSRAANIPVNVFDHSHALLGPAAGQGPDLVERLKDDGYFNGCLVAHVTERSHFEGWLRRLDAFDDEMCHDIVDQARAAGALVLPADVAAAKMVIVYRKNRMRTLLDEAISSGRFAQVKVAPKGES